MVATYRAIEVACTALVRVLTEALPPRRPGDPFEVRLVGVGELTDGSFRNATGLLPYRVRPGGGPAAPPHVGDGAPPLVVDVQLLVLVAADDPATRLALAGWAVRTLHDTPVLVPGAVEPPAREDHPVFSDGEQVQVTADETSRSELLQLYDALGLSGCDALVLPYVLRGLRLDPAGPRDV